MTQRKEHIDVTVEKRNILDRYFNFNTFVTTLATSLVLFACASFFSSYQSKQTELQLKELFDFKHQQELENLKTNDKLDYIIEWIKEQKQKEKK